MGVPSLAVPPNGSMLQAIGQVSAVNTIVLFSSGVVRSSSSMCKTAARPWSVAVGLGVGRVERLDSPAMHAVTLYVECYIRNTDVCTVSSMPS